MTRNSIKVNLLFFCLFQISLVGINSAQSTATYDEPIQSYQDGLSLFENHHYHLAFNAFQEFLSHKSNAFGQSFKGQIADAKVKSAICQIRTGNEKGENTLLTLINQYKPDPICNQAIFEVGDYYYNTKNYDKAIAFYKLMNIDELPIDKASELSFKQGYAHFVKKEFEAAQACFNPVAKYKNIYYYPINYYNAVCFYFDGQYREAVQGFKRVEASRKYAPHVPYYIAQIYFQEREYTTLIEFASTRLDENKYQKVNELKQLIGKSWYEKSYFERALPYLEEFAAATPKMTAEDFYQLAYVQYQTGYFEKAIPNFKEVANLNTEMAQNANYFIGDSYIQLSQLPSARTAFSKVAKMDFNPALKEEATFNFGKLSAELNYDREAVKALLLIPDNSKYSIEAKQVINDIFINTKDYKKALEILADLPNKPENVLRTEQQVAYSYGVQLMNDGDLENAAKYFQQAADNSIDNAITAKAVFWRGDLKYRAGEYEAAIKDLQYYRLFPQEEGHLETSKANASYTIGFAFLKQKSFSQARNHFNEAAKAIKANFIDRESLQFQMLSDAVIRSGDCSFKLNNYVDAAVKYKEAVNNEYVGYDYAWFQNALILGLRKKEFEKIITLEELVSTLPTSRYADDALFQLGKSYFEMEETAKASASLSMLIAEYGDRSELTNKAYLQLGLIKYNEGDVNGALANYKSIIGNNPDPADVQDALDGIREIYVQELSKPEEYIAYVDSIPGFESSQFSQDSLTYAAAEFQYDNGDYEKALKRFTTYIEKFENGAFKTNAHFFRGEIYLQNDNYSAALSDYEEVIIRGAGSNYDKALRKGATIAYNHTKNYVNAFDYYAKLEQAAANNNIIYESQLGAVRSAYRAQLNEELDLFATKVRKNRKASSEERAETYYYQGKSALAQQKDQEAIDYFNEVDKRTDNALGAESRYLIAKIYFDRKEYPIAKKLCENINQDNSAYPYWIAQNLILYADVLVATKDIFNARAAIEAVLENFTDNQEITKMASDRLAEIEKIEIQNSRLLQVSKDSLQMDTLK